MSKPNLIDVRATARRQVVAGSGRTYDRGDVGREDADDPTTAHLLDVGLLVPVDTDRDEAPEPEGGLAPPSGNAPTADWVAYAARIGVDVPDGARRDDVRQAIADAGHPTT